ncbi:MAG: hypothetical protein NTZ17_06510 [Phycisphaerae bacterium]|nr:hypothetical protein [Phycisphaerae bacterium]
MTTRLGTLTLALSLASICSAYGQISKEVRDVVGVTHVAGLYHLTDRDFLNEGADQILALGSRVIKVWFYAGQSEAIAKSYPYNSQWPKVDSLVEGARTPYFKTLFEKPFSTYILKVTALGRDEGYWRSGITDEQKKDEQRQFYELAKYLLTQYQGTGKTFVLQHWEGDWMVRGNYQGDVEPAPAALANMVEWLNARQAGVNQARQEVGQSSVSRASSPREDAAKMAATREQGVHVYHATEVNRVVQSMRSGFPNLVNKVLPHTHLDLVSYSAWDSATEHYTDPKVLRDALDFIAANAPDSADFGNRNVYIGEFGMPENGYSLDKIQTAIPNAVRTALDWGCPYIVYWQLYCNELKDPKTKPPVKSNDAIRGFWLIRPDGTKAWTWDYFHGLFTAP